MSMIANLIRVPDAELRYYLKDSAALEDRIYAEDAHEDPATMDLDKAWDGILFLLTGEAVASSEHPLHRVLFSGQLIDEEQDLGYGPAHYLLPDQVIDVEKEIAGISTMMLKSRFDPALMTKKEVYPAIWEEGETAFEYLEANFASLQLFYATAARNSEAVITYLN